MRPIGDLLREVMERRGLSQIDVAIATGVPQPALSRVLNRQSDLKTKNLTALERAYPELIELRHDIVVPT